MTTRVIQDGVITGNPGWGVLDYSTLEYFIKLGDFYTLYGRKYGVSFNSSSRHGASKYYFASLKNNLIFYI